MRPLWLARKQLTMLLLLLEGGATNYASQVTNLSTLKVAATNVVSGGVLPLGTVSATSMNTNTILVANTVAQTRDWSGSPIITNATLYDGTLLITNATVSIKQNGINGISITNGSRYFVIGTNAQLTSVTGASLMGDNVAINTAGVRISSSVGNTFNWNGGQQISAPNVNSIGMNKALWATNGYGHQFYMTNQVLTCVSNIQIYCLNGTNQLVTLFDAALNPWVIYRFVSTNGNGNFTITNATGTQTIRDGATLSLKNIGVGEVGLFSDGSNWQLASKFRTIWPNAQFSCTTNIALGTTARAVSFNTTDFNNSQGIALLVGTNATWGQTSIWITNAGQYEFDPSVVETYDGNHTVTFWFKRNLTNILNSATACKGANNTTKVVTVPFVVNVTEATQFEIWAISDDAAGEGFQFQAAGGAAPNDFPLSPSVICPIKRISDSRP